VKALLRRLVALWRARRSKSTLGWPAISVNSGSEAAAVRKDVETFRPSVFDEIGDDATRR
jgi:hypothetical protein